MSSLWDMLPKDLLVGREKELAILEQLYEKSVWALLQQKLLDEHAAAKAKAYTKAAAGKSSSSGSKLRKVMSGTRLSSDSRRRGIGGDVDDSGTSTPLTTQTPQSTNKNTHTRHHNKKMMKMSSSRSNGAVFCHLQGKPGVGKTALVQTFASRQQRGFFFSYKFQQFVGLSTSPMIAIVQTLSQLAHQTVTCQNYSSLPLRNQFLTNLLQIQQPQSSGGQGITLRALVDLVPAYGEMLNSLVASSSSTSSNTTGTTTSTSNNNNNNNLDHLTTAATSSNTTTTTTTVNDSTTTTTTNKTTIAGSGSGSGSTTVDSLLLPIPDGLAGTPQNVLYPVIAHILRETRKFAQTPIVWFLDDVQWMDTGSKSVIRYLINDACPLFIIVSFRDEMNSSDSAYYNYSSESTFALESLLGHKATTQIESLTTTTTPTIITNDTNDNNDTANEDNNKNNKNTTTTTSNKITIFSSTSSLPEEEDEDDEGDDDTMNSNNNVELVGLYLEDFTRSDVSELLSYLKLPKHDHTLLTKYLYDLTKGNPFYLRFRLSVMAETGALMEYRGTNDEETSSTTISTTTTTETTSTTTTTTVVQQPSSISSSSYGLYNDKSSSSSSIIRWRLDPNLIGSGLEIQSLDAVDYCTRVLNTLDSSILAVLCRLAVMPQGKTLDEYTIMLTGEEVLEGLARTMTTTQTGNRTGTGKGDSGADNNDCCTVRDVLKQALLMGVQKSILYHHHHHNEGDTQEFLDNDRLGGDDDHSSLLELTTTFADGTTDEKEEGKGGDDGPTTTAIIETIQKSWINTAAFSFAHDRLQQAAAKCLTNNEEEAAFHFFLGKQRLLVGRNKREEKRANTTTAEEKNDQKIQEEVATTTTTATNPTPPTISAPSTTTMPTTSLNEENNFEITFTGDDEEVAMRKEREAREQDVEAFGILHHFYMARDLVKDPDLILQIGELAAHASGYHVTAGSHEQFDTMLQFVRDLLDLLQKQHQGEQEGHNKDNSNHDDSGSSIDPLSQKISSLQVQLLIAHHQIKFLMNDLTAAEEVFNAVRPRLSSFKEIRDAYFSRISLLINIADNDGAIAAVGEALALLKEESYPPDLVLPEGEPAKLLLDVTQRIKTIFLEHPDWNVEQVASSFPISTDEDHNFRVETMISVIASFYLIGRFDFYLYLPSLACLKILEKGLTRSSGHAFSVLGFALVAMFGDNFGAEVAMIGRHLVERFDNPTCECRALVLSGIAVIYDARYERLASDQLYTSYVAGRTAHDLTWACYGVYMYSSMQCFDGSVLPEVVDCMEDMITYAMSSGHQPFTQRACRAFSHSREMLMTGQSDAEGPVFHFHLPDDELAKILPLLPFSHAAASVIVLFFDNKLGIAWSMIQEVFDNGLDQSAPGMPTLYAFHIYTVFVCHGILRAASSSEIEAKDFKTSIPVMESARRTSSASVINGILSEEERDKLKVCMTKSLEFLEERNRMAPIFTAHARLAKGCILDIIDDKPWDALKEFEAALKYMHKERRGKQFDLKAVSHLLSADIFQRQGLDSTRSMHQIKALSALQKWGADYIVEKMSKGMKATFDDSEESSLVSYSRNGVIHVSEGSSGSVGSNTTPLGSTTTPLAPTTRSGSVTQTQSARTRESPNFAAILSTASYISTFSCFDELVGKLSSSLLKQATATRLLLLIRHSESDDLEPTAECTVEGLSSQEALLGSEYSSSIVKITDLLKESVVIHSAQLESPYCFESYIRESKVQSVASMPITYKDAVIAVVYLEHNYTQGVFTPDIMATMALLAQNVSSALVNARLLRDVRKHTVQLEQSHTFLAKALRVKDTILSNTSHELRSPLNGIIGLNECVLMSDIELHPEVQNCAKSTLAMARQLLSLVEDILDLSRIGQGAFQLHYETSDVKSLVDEVFEVAKFSLGNNTSLVNKVKPAFDIMVDPGRLKQAITNLISNAIKFTPEGSVTVTGEFLDDKSMCVISVVDTGIGMEPSHMDVIFEPFFQVTSYETRQHSGAGLGLSITKQLVELHGGRIDVVSKVGVGTSFHMYFPTTPPIRSEPLSTKISGSSGVAEPEEPHPALEPDAVVAANTEMSTGSAKGAPTGASGDGKPEISSTADTQPENKAIIHPLFPITDNTLLSTDLPSEVAQGRSVAPLFPPSDTDASRIPAQVVNTRKPSSSTQTFSDPKKTEINDGLTASEVSVANNVASAPAEPIARVSKDSLDQEPLRVLAVDDTPINLKVVSNFLLKAGMLVDTATNGQQCLEKLEGDQWTNYDVILLDWMMPVMDGISACRLLRQRIPSDLLPVIFLTAKTDPGAVQKGFEAGGTDFSTKPLNRQGVIARTMCQGLASRRARARYFEAIPIAVSILTKDPFWKMRPASGEREMFVVCLNVPCQSCGLDGPLLLKYFRHEESTARSDWQFCEVGRKSVSFLTANTTHSQIIKFVRAVLSCWAEMQMLASTSVMLPTKEEKPVVTVGVDYLPVRAHLFGEQQPMLAAVESCAFTAQLLAGKGTEHEDIMMSESAQSAMSAKMTGL